MLGYWTAKRDTKKRVGGCIAFSGVTVALLGHTWTSLDLNKNNSEAVAIQDPESVSCSFTVIQASSANIMSTCAAVETDPGIGDAFSVACCTTFV